MEKKNDAIETVDFHGDKIVAVKRDGEVYVVLKRTCESLGVEYSSQLSKLRNTSWAGICDSHITASDGKNYRTACIPAKRLPMWLVTIDSGKVKPELREKLELYKVEAADALAAHFMGAPVPVRPPSHNPLLAAMLQPWELTWQDDLCSELCRLNDYSWRKGQVHPRWMGKINSIIYECCLGRDMYDEMRAAIRRPSRGRNRHQQLTSEAKSAFVIQINQVVTIAQCSNNLETFIASMRHVFQKKALQLGLVVSARKSVAVRSKKRKAS